MNNQDEELIVTDFGTVKSKEYFYVGDPCYVLDDDTYDDMCYKIQDWDVEHGKWIDNFGVIKTEKGEMLVHKTLYGDGTYESPIGEVSVDSGLIAIIPDTLLDQDKFHRILDDNAGCRVYGTEANLLWITGDTESEYGSRYGTFEINIKNPDYSFQIHTGKNINESMSDMKL